MPHRLSKATVSPIQLRLYLFGAFRIERAAQTIHLPTRKHESLLAYLVLHPEAHPREKLATLFWGDFIDEQARHSLRAALAAIRKELGDEILIADRETVQLNPDCPLWTDARGFERLTLEDPQAAMGLYCGDLLNDFYDDWIPQERERLRALYLDGLLWVTQDARSQSQYARAIEFAQKVLASDPANEKAYQHTIFCLAMMGDRSGALKQYDKCERKLRDELGVKPSEETLALRDRIKQELTGGKSRAALFTNVPVPLTNFIGREHEMAETRRIIETTRLVTLVGAGGCGKTRLAIQVATDLASANRFESGVWWVDLAPLRDAALVPQAIATVFNLQESSGIPLPTVLVNYFRAKELLLVLDNCEHLLDACARLVDTWLSTCSKLQVLATSREPLGIPGEVAWRVPSLALPDVERLPAPDQMRQYDAIQLFTDRALAVSPTWRLAEHCAPAARVCARLDGIPLAIELAAARLRVLSVEQVAERLDDRFNLLTGGSRTALPRHQTLRGAMDWSYNLLSGAESVLLRRLAVFAGGFSLKAAEAICGEKDEGGRMKDETRPFQLHPLSLIFHPFGVLDLLTALVDKSLVIVETRGKATRYRLLETIRQYAHEKLLEANESKVYARRHRDWFLQLAEHADPKLRGRGQLAWCERLERDIENLRAALTWSLAQTDHYSTEMALRLAGALVWFWLLRGYWDEARTWLERSLENRGITPVRAKALMGLALTEYFAGTVAKCHVLWDEALALYRQQGDKWGIAFAASFSGVGESDLSKANALFEEARSIAQELKDEWLAARAEIGRGMYAHRRGDLALARSLFESALDHARRSGDSWAIGNALGFWGEVALDQGDDDRAAMLFTESLQVRRELGNKNGMAINVYNLGKIALRRHDGQRAGALFKQALALRHEMGNTRGVLECFWALGRVAAAEQRYERAARLLGSIEPLWEMLEEKGRREYEDDIRAVCAQLGEPVFNQARAEGRAMPLEQAVEYALENVKEISA